LEANAGDGQNNQQIVGILANTKADFSDYSGLFELEANADDGQNNQQIVGVIY
jgi:hypothetical protein